MQEEDFVSQETKTNEDNTEEFLWNNMLQQLIDRKAHTPVQRLKRAVKIHSLSIRFGHHAFKLAQDILADLAISNDDEQRLKFSLTGLVIFVDRQNIRFQICVASESDFIRNFINARQEAQYIRFLLSEDIEGVHLPLTALCDYLGFRILASARIPGPLALEKHSPADRNTAQAIQDSFREKCRLTIHPPFKHADGRHYWSSINFLFPCEIAPPTLTALIIFSDPLQSFAITSISSTAALEEEVRSTLSVGSQVEECGEINERGGGNCVGKLYAKYTVTGFRDHFSDWNPRATRIAGVPVRGDAILLLHSEPIVQRPFRHELIVSAPLGPTKSLDSHTLQIYLYATIMKFAALLDRRALVFNSTAALANAMHQHGINIRHAGQIRKNITLEYPSLLLLRLMAARVGKMLLRHKLRNCFLVKQRKRICAAFFNDLLSLSGSGTEFWLSEMKAYMLLKFPDGLSETERSASFSIRNKIGTGFLAHDIATMMGIRYSANAIAELQKGSCSAKLFPFTEESFLGFEPIIWHCSSDSKLIRLAHEAAGVTFVDESEFSVMGVRGTTSQCRSLLGFITRAKISPFMVAYAQVVYADALLRKFLERKSDDDNLRDEIVQLLTEARETLTQQSTSVIDYELNVYTHCIRILYEVGQRAAAMRSARSCTRGLYANLAHPIDLYLTNLIIEGLCASNRKDEIEKYLNRFLESWRVNPLRGNSKDICRLFSIGSRDEVPHIFSFLGNTIAGDNKSEIFWLRHIRLVTPVDCKDTNAYSAWNQLSLLASDTKLRSPFDSNSQNLLLPQSSSSIDSMSNMSMNNSEKDLLYGTKKTHTTLCQIFPLTKLKIVSVAANEYCTFAVSETGEVFSWGAGGDAMGHENSTDESLRHHPTRIESLMRDSYRIIQVACSSNQTNLENFTLFLSSNGDVLTCGNNRFKQLGQADLEIATRSIPAPIQFDTTSSTQLPNRVIRVWAGSVHAVALDSDGRVFTWGCNVLGQCGQGYDLIVPKPTAVGHIFPNAGKSICVSVLHDTTALVTESGDIYWWGVSCWPMPADLSPEFVSEFQVYPRALILPLEYWDVRFVQVSVGLDHALLLDDSGRVISLGGNSFGQLGVRPEDTRIGIHYAGIVSALAIPLKENDVVTEVVAAEYYSLAKTASGELFRWGGDKVNPLAPTSVIRGLLESHVIIRHPHCWTTETRTAFSYELKKLPKLRCEISLAPGEHLRDLPIEISHSLPHDFAFDDMLFVRLKSRDKENKPRPTIPMDTVVEVRHLGAKAVNRERIYLPLPGKYDLEYIPNGNPLMKSIVCSFEISKERQVPSSYIKSNVGRDIAQLLRGIVVGYQNANCFIRHKSWQHSEPLLHHLKNPREDLGSDPFFDPDTIIHLLEAADHEKTPIALQVAKLVTSKAQRHHFLLSCLSSVRVLALMRLLLQFPQFFEPNTPEMEYFLNRNSGYVVKSLLSEMYLSQDKVPATQELEKALHHLGLRKSITHLHRLAPAAGNQIAWERSEKKQCLFHREQDSAGKNTLFIRSVHLHHSIGTWVPILRLREWSLIPLGVHSKTLAATFGENCKAFHFGVTSHGIEFAACQLLCQRSAEYSPCSALVRAVLQALIEPTANSVGMIASLIESVQDVRHFDVSDSSDAVTLLAFVLQRVTHMHGPFYVAIARALIQKGVNLSVKVKGVPLVVLAKTQSSLVPVVEAALVKFADQGRALSEK